VRALLFLLELLRLLEENSVVQLPNPDSLTERTHSLSLWLPEGRCIGHNLLHKSGSLD
jgi:hypothetical protein